MKKLCCLLLVVCLFTACGSVRDDMPVQILAAALGEEIEGFENLTSASADYIRYCMGSDLSLYEEYVVLYPFSGTEYNEIGVFKLKNADDIGKGREELQKYLTFKKDNWDTRYNGEEFNKIETSRIQTCGRYLLYTILATNEANAVTERFEKELQ